MRHLGASFLLDIKTMIDFKADDILKALGLAGAGIAWVLQTRAKLQREKIKLDLEILEKSKAAFGDNDDRTRKVATKVTLLMSYLYRDLEAKPLRSFSWSYVALAMACFAGAGAFALTGSGQFWNLAVAGVLAFIGVGAVMNAFEIQVPRADA